MDKSNCNFCFYINDIGEGPYISFDRVATERKWKLSVNDYIFDTDEEKFNDLNQKIQKVFAEEPYITLS